jgi:hypothetical protein
MKSEEKEIMGLGGYVFLKKGNKLIRTKKRPIKRELQKIDLKKQIDKMPKIVYKNNEQKLWEEELNNKKENEV